MMNFDELARLAEAEMQGVMASLPKGIRSEIARVPVFFETMPSPLDVQSGIEEDTLGYFDAGELDSPTPRIRLWLSNIWDFAGEDVRTFREEVRVTLLHEIGHHLGWDEDDLEQRGLD